MIQSPIVNTDGSAAMSAPAATGDSAIKAKSGGRPRRIKNKSKSLGTAGTAPSAVGESLPVGPANGTPNEGPSVNKPVGQAAKGKPKRGEPTSTTTVTSGLVTAERSDAAAAKKRSQNINRRRRIIPDVKKQTIPKTKLLPFSRPGVVVPKKESADGNKLADLMAEISLEDNTEEVQLYNSFEDMGLKPKLLEGIYLYGLEKPAFVQQRVIIPCAKGRDVIVQAQSGMGKTAALAISLLQRIDINDPHCQAIVIAPTRELAEQICTVFAELGKKMGVTTFACIGGTKLQNCKEQLLMGKQIVVGTTGRLYHMLSGDSKGGPYLTVDSIKALALDEADHMLTKDFARDMTEIFAMTPPTAQMILTSATMPEHTLKLTTKFMHNPLKCLVKNEQLTLDGIQQYYLNVETEEWKLSVLDDIYNQISKAQGMIFCNTRKRVDRISKEMQSKGHIVSAMRGDLDQSERDLILREFRMGQGASRMLITSDLLARGIDVQQVNLVINYDVPIKKEEYIHRVGRGGRYGRKGVAITFVTLKELEQLQELQQFYQTEIKEMPKVDDLVSLLLPLAKN